MMHSISQGNRVWDTLYIYAYDSNYEIFTPFYTEIFLLNFIYHHKYTYIQTYSTIAIITNIFIKQSIILGRVVKYKRRNIKNMLSI